MKTIMANDVIILARWIITHASLNAKPNHEVNNLINVMAGEH